MDKTEESGPQRERDNRGTPPPPLQPGPTTVLYFAAWFSNGSIFLVLHIQISLVRYRCFMGIYFSCFSSRLGGALQLLQLLSHTTYWQLDYGYYAIWSRLMQQICTKEDPLWEHLKHTFIHIKPHPNNMWDMSETPPNKENTTIVWHFLKCS